MRAVDDALMGADWLPLGDDLEAIRIDAQADSAIGERGRYAVAIALKVDEAGRRYGQSVQAWPHRGDLKEGCPACAYRS